MQIYTNYFQVGKRYPKLVKTHFQTISTSNWVIDEESANKWSTCNFWMYISKFQPFCSLNWHFNGTFCKANPLFAYRNEKIWRKRNIFRIFVSFKPLTKMLLQWYLYWCKNKINKIWNCALNMLIHVNYYKSGKRYPKLVKMHCQIIHASLTLIDQDSI